MAREMLGTAHWHGTYDGNPAIVLSCFCGADLWVYQDKWVLEMEWGCLVGLEKKLGVIDDDSSYNGMEAVVSDKISERDCLLPKQVCMNECEWHKARMMKQAIVSERIASTPLQMPVGKP